MTHLIGTQILNLIIKDKNDPYAQQQWLYDLYWDQLLPALNDLFDELSTQDEIIRINNLEVDLGKIDLKQVDHKAIIELMIDQIRTSLKNKLYKEKGTDSLVIPMRERHFEQWMQWLHKGYMPGIDLFQAKDWQKSILDTLGLSSQRVLQLQMLLQSNSLALQRLVDQHPDHFLVNLTELYTGFNQQALIGIQAEFKIIHRSGVVSKSYSTFQELKKELWKMILRKTVAQRNKLKPREIARSLLCQSSLWPGASTFMQEVSASTADATGHPQLPVLSALIRESLADPAQRAEQQLPKTEKPEEDAMQVIQEPLFFANAGVVLVHPFLPMLFEKLKLTQGVKFKSDKKRNKAILLIHYLATGTDDTQDFELLLPKLLCGLPFNESLDFRLRLSKREKAEADKLLQAAIAHWGALGEVSPDALREGFLSRKGKLIQQSGRWKLFLEQKPIDLLLDRLPWGMGMVKLPWMNEMITVEWR